MNTDGSGILIRQASQSDALAISALMPDLGYEATSEEMARRLGVLEGLPEQVVLVSVSGAGVIGVCQIQGVRLIASDGYAEIQALVVQKASQRQGVGSSLVRAAIDWAFRYGYERIRLRSGVHREDAHRFYESLGFERKRPSYAFEIKA